MPYDYEQLDPERFQHLCQALILKEFPGTNCLPVGQPDGGRDAIHIGNGTPEISNCVFQVKFSRQARNKKEAREWLAQSLDEELPKVSRLIERGASRYFILTNVAGTSHLDEGS